VLKRWKGGSLAWILALACFSLKSLKGITQEWREGSERALFWLWKEFSSKERQERERTEGGEGVFIPLDPKIAVRRTVTRRLRVYARRLRATLTFRPENSTRTLRAKGSGVSGPVPGVSGLGRMKTHVLLFWVYFVALRCLSRFSWAQDLNRNPWIKSLLIVRRPYTQISNIKSNSLSMLELRLFISFLRGRTSSFVSPIQTHHLHTCSITRLNIHVFCHYSPKPT